MNNNFRVVFYLKGNVRNKEGKTTIMTRIYMGSERLCIGSTGFSIDAGHWDSSKLRCKGRTPEVLNINSQLIRIETDLNKIYRTFEFSDELSLEKIKSEYLRPATKSDYLMPFYEKFIEERKEEVGISLSSTSIQKYNVVRRHFSEYIYSKYRRKDVKFVELDHSMMSGFEHYLRTVAQCQNNTVMRMLRTFKTVLIHAMKLGILKHDPYANMKIHFEPVDRGYLTDDEIVRMMDYEFSTKRLEQVRDTFVFSCFTGLAYIDVAQLTKDNIKEFDGQLWIMTRRQKTKVASNIPLLDVPRMLIEKYEGKVKDGRLMPILSNQKQNAYLHEIATLCGIEKNLTCHLARHTFATLALSKGVPVESVSKMLGHTNIKTTQIYAKITSQKVKGDMDMLATKLGKFSEVGIQKTESRGDSHDEATLKATKKRGRPLKDTSVVQDAVAADSYSSKQQPMSAQYADGTMPEAASWGYSSFVYV